MNLLFPVALMTGLAGSFHCVGMCGPIALALPIGNRSVFEAALSGILYNLGRIITYGVLGAIFGYFGKTIYSNCAPMPRHFFKPNCFMK